MSLWRAVKHDDYIAAPGVYVLLQNGRVLYVGQSVNISERLKQHRFVFTLNGIKTKWGFLENAIIKCRKSRAYGDWLMIEARLIRRLKPSLNRKLTVAGQFARRHEFLGRQRESANENAALDERVAAYLELGKGVQEIARTLQISVRNVYQSVMRQQDSLA